MRYDDDSACCVVYNPVANMSPRCRICVTKGGIVRDSAVLGYVCISDEINIEHVEIVGENLHFV